MTFPSNLAFNSLIFVACKFVINFSFVTMWQIALDRELACAASGPFVSGSIARRRRGVLIGRPVFLRETPDFTIIAAMDALSDVLRVLRLTGAVFLDAEFTAPWCVVSEGGRPLPGVAIRADHVAFFHLLTDGRCTARLAAGGESIELKAGDLLMLPHDDTHLMGSDLRLPAVPSDGLVQPAPPGGMMRIAHGGGGDTTRFVCGYLACDRRLCRPVLDALPSILRVPVGSGPATVWLTSLLALGAQESSSPARR